MNSLWRRPISLLVVGALGFLPSLSPFGTWVDAASASATATVSPRDVVVAGGLNTKAFTVQINGTPSNGNAQVISTSFFFESQTPTSTSSTSACAAAGVTITANSSVRCGVGVNGVNDGGVTRYKDIYIWDGGYSAITVTIGSGKVRFSSSASQAVSVNSGPIFSNTQFFSLVTSGSTAPQPQSPISLANTNGTVGQGLELTSTGGSGTGTVGFYISSAGTASCTLSGSTLSATQQGSCDVVVYKLSDSQYDTIESRVTVQWQAKISQGTLSIKSSSQSGTFGTDIILSTDGGSGSGAVTYSAANGPSTTGCSVIGAVLTSTSAGTCLVTATKAGDTTYSPASSAQTTVTIAKASRSLSFATTSIAIAYGNTDTALATASAGDGAVTYSAGSSTACSVNSSTGAVLSTQASGTCSITATIAEGTNYLSASTTTSVTVTTGTRPLTVRASDATVNFGTTYSTNPLATGLFSNDAVSGATYIYEGTGSTVYGPSTTKPTDAGTYKVTPSAATFSTGLIENYAITYQQGSIQISKVSRTLSFGGTTSATVSFGNTVTVSATPSAGDGAITYSTASSGCNVNASTGVVTATGNTGTCTISATIAEGTNHLTASTTTSFTVTLAKRAITIDVPDFEVSFGDSVSPARTISVGSLADSDVISGVTYTYVGTSGTTYSSSTTAPTAAGTYTVTPSVAVFSSGSSANYTVSFTPGTLTITKRAITLKASNLSVVVKSTITPAYTVTVGSLLQGDVISGVTYSFAGTGSTSYTSSATAPTEPGSYTITPSLAVFSAGESSNYVVTYAPGTLTITKNQITISVQNLDVAFGAAVSPTYTVSSGSLLAGDAISGVTISYRGSGSTPYVLSTSAPSASGTYDLIASDPVFSTGVAANYQITFVNGALTIQAAPVAPAPSSSTSPTTQSSPAGSTRSPARSADPTVVSTRPAAPITPPTAQSSGKVMVGGVAVSPVVEKPNGGSSVSVQVGSIQMGLSFDDGPNGKGRVDSGSAAGSSAIPELFIPAGNSSSMSGKGLFPGSTLQIWLGGNESAGTKELARIPVNADGSYDGKIVFASRPTEAPVALGRQVIQMSGFDADGNQTVVDMVINIAQGPVVPETMRADGSRPALALGEFMATSAGLEAPVEAKIRDDQSGVSFAGESWSFELGNAGVSVSGSELAPEIRFLDGGNATFKATGLMPGTTASVWFFSDPVLAGSAEVTEDGTLSIDFRVDSAFIPVGEHTLQLQGVGSDGFIVAVNWGVAVEESVADINAILQWIIGGALALFASAAAVLIYRRRRLEG